MKIVVGQIESSTGWGECFAESREGVCFPSRGWTDNALIVVGSLVSGLSRMLVGETRFYEWFFYDGPFRVEFVKVGMSESIIARGIEDRSIEVCTFEDRTDIRELLREGAESIRRIDAAVSRASLRSDIVLSLDRFLAIASKFYD